MRVFPLTDLGDAKVCNLDVAVAIEHQILRLDISMYYVIRVNVL